jgi:hypothetical protein
VDEGKVNEEEFFSAVSESSSKIYLQNLKLSKTLLAAGDVSSALAVMGGLALVRNKLWQYNEFLQVYEKPRAFKDAYLDVCQLLESLTEQVLEYTKATMATAVLQDPAGNDWDNPRSFYEGEKVAHCVQAWWYHLQGLRHDLWRSAPPTIAKKLFSAAFLDSLGVLVNRYCAVRPSPGRVGQFRADVTAILLISTEVLPMIAGSVGGILAAAARPDVGQAEPELFGHGLGGVDGGSSAVVYEVHAKCRRLLAALAIVGAPIHAVSAIADEKVNQSTVVIVEASS